MEGRGGRLLVAPALGLVAYVCFVVLIVVQCCLCACFGTIVLEGIERFVNGMSLRLG